MLDQSIANEFVNRVFCKSEKIEEASDYIPRTSPEEHMRLSHAHANEATRISRQYGYRASHPKVIKHDRYAVAHERRATGKRGTLEQREDQRYYPKNRRIYNE